MLRVESFHCGPLENNIYLLLNEEARTCAVLDPGIDTQKVRDYIEQHALAVEHILLTHAHFDHVFELGEYKEQYQAPIYLHPADLPLLERLPEIAASWDIEGVSAPPKPDVLLEHGQVLEICGMSIEVRHTPGHSPGQVAFIFPGNALVGDTLFHRGIGRWDLPEADYHALERSITTQLYTLPDETVVWPGHGSKTTIGEEKRFNPFIGEGARLLPKL